MQNEMQNNSLKNRIKKRREKGITLIALIVTIIVIIILAAIMLLAITGQNGLMSKAEEARKENDRGAIKDQIETEVLGSYGVDGKIDWEELEKNLEENVGAKNIKPKDGENKENGLELEVEKNGNVFNVEVDKDGNVEVNVKGGETKPSANPSTEPTTVPSSPSGATYFCSVCNASFRVEHYKCASGHHFTTKPRRQMHATSTNRNKLHLFNLFTTFISK